MNDLVNNLFAKSSKMMSKALTTLGSIDFDDVNKAFKETTSSIKSQIEPLIAKAKTFKTKNVIEFPYDNKTSKLSFKIEDNILEVTITSFDGTSTNGFRFTIPETADVNNIHQTYDSERGVIVFKFGNKETV